MKAPKNSTGTSQGSVTVSVPATTANLGPGFDSFGIALDLHNEVILSPRISGVALPPMVARTAESFFRGSGIPPFAFSWKIRGRVPRARGLGSSVTVRLGTLLGLNHLCGNPLSRHGLFRLCADLEDHPDNAAPAAFGGFTIARGHRDPVRYPVSPDIRFILLIPDFEVATPEARKVMPKSIGISDAAANAADAAVIAAAFATKRYELLRGAFGDRVHQPFRKKLVPFLDEVVGSGASAGALGGWLSGSGSTICCVAPDESSAKRVGAALRKAAPRGSKVLLCGVDNKGASLRGSVSA